MSRRVGFAIVVACALTLGAITGAGAGRHNGLIVHEWGTFTSIAGEDGRAVQWLPLSGPSDLPCFVERAALRIKNSIRGAVRMETPVIYFYARRPTTVNVSVRFRKGLITEWFPRPAGWASGEAPADALGGQIRWRNVDVMPGASPAFPVESGESHYYVARDTDAAPVVSGGEMERFLFYRGVGQFAPPIAAVVDERGRVSVRNTRGDALGDVMLFENRDGRVSYQTRHTADASVVFDGLEVAGEGAAPLAKLEQMLVAHGLYPKEARAMVESWRSSWFEHGTRVFYILPTDAVDAMLPLQIEPRPLEMARVFVGRIEVATPATLGDMRDALRRGERTVLDRYGRFLEPMAARVLSTVPPGERPALQNKLQEVYASWTAPEMACGPSS